MKQKYFPPGLTVLFNGNRTFRDANNGQVWDVFKQLESTFRPTGSEANDIYIYGENKAK